jgi:hypothetical protein
MTETFEGIICPLTLTCDEKWGEIGQIQFFFVPLKTSLKVIKQVGGVRELIA